MLAEVCRELIGDNPSPERVAQSYLHVRSAHPSSLSAYISLFEGHGVWRDHLSIFAKTQALKFLALIRQEPLYFGDEMPDQADILFISHFTNPNQAATRADAYFGELPAQLSTNGHSSVVAHINHTWAGEKDIQAHWQTQLPPRIILSRTIGLGSEALLAKRLSTDGRLLLSQQPLNKFTQKVVRYTAANATNGNSKTALRTAVQIDAIVRRLKPKFLVSTFEGHAWEWLAFYAARSANPDIKCIGYHHTVLFPLQHALGTSLGHGYDPDAILTAGEISTNWFLDQTDWKNLPVKTLGSVRTAQAGIGETPSAAEGCLVIPEGIIDEAVLLFQLAVATASLLPNQAFKLRLHPVLSKADVLKMAPGLRNLPPNISWSTSSLEDELAQNRTVLYRGSTLAITAVLSGLRPFYVAAPIDQISIDPLKELASWRKNTPSAEVLRDEIQKDQAATAAERQVEYSSGHAYCMRYFTPMSLLAFEAMMHKISSS